MKAKFLAVLALAVMLAVPSFASAQVREGSVHVSPMVGYFFNDISISLNDGGKIKFDDGMIYSIGVGYNFTENWGLEVTGSYAPSLDSDDAHYRGVNFGKVADMDVSMASVNALYHFNTDSAFVPYITAGLGGIWGSTDFRNDINVGDNSSYGAMQANAGLGFKYFFNDTVALRVQGQWIHGFDDNMYDSNDNVAVQAGLTFQFGPRTDCVDSDGDGVCDDYDKCPGTPAGYKVDADGCPITVTIRMDVKFDFNKSVVKSEYRPEVAKVADFMKQHPQTRTTVEGHTDSVGSDEYNQKLSQRRADAVREVLVQHFGIEASRLTSIGHGETQPIADNNTEEGRALNRRVVGVVEGAELD